MQYYMQSKLFDFRETQIQYPLHPNFDRTRVSFCCIHPSITHPCVVPLNLINRRLIRFRFAVHYICNNDNGSLARPFHVVRHSIAPEIIEINWHVLAVYKHTYTLEGDAATAATASHWLNAVTTSRHCATTLSVGVLARRKRAKRLMHSRRGVRSVCVD